MLVSASFVVVRSATLFAIAQKISMAQPAEVTSSLSPNALVKNSADQYFLLFSFSDCSGDPRTIWL